MLRATEEALKVSLTEAIDQWFETSAEEIGGLPIVGDDIAEIMASAGLAVLRGIDNTQEYLKHNHDLKD